MRHDFEPATREIRGVRLSGREQLILVEIIQHWRTNGQPPSQVELLDKLNSYLRPKPNNSTFLTSRVQISRTITKLREKKLLRSDAHLENKHRNYLPTAFGEEVADKLRGIWDKELDDGLIKK